LRPLGETNVNIAVLYLGRIVAAEDAVVLVGVEQTLDAALIAAN
jgi:hypothetical protein